MKIEILYSEIANLYGDSSNIKFLKKCIPNAIFYETKLNDIPKFTTEDISLIYIGSCSEKGQELIIKALSKHIKELEKYIENNKILIATGNSFEIFGKYILDLNTNKKIKCLNIIDFYSEFDIKHRHNSLFLGKFNKMKIMGYKSQFSHSIYCSTNYFIKLERGEGLNKNAIYEGINYKNFYGTYLLGPFLILNPDFTKYILKILNQKEKLPFEKEIYDAYRYRLSEFENQNTKFGSNHE